MTCLLNGSRNEKKKDCAEAIRQLRAEWDNKHLNFNGNAEEQKREIA